MTREEAMRKLYDISITDLGSKCVGHCTYSDAEELIDKIYDDFEKKELGNGMTVSEEREKS